MGSLETVLARISGFFKSKKEEENNLYKEIKIPVSEKYNIVSRPEFIGNLKEEDLKQVLKRLPFDFEFVPEEWNPNVAYLEDKKGKIDVYCYNSIIMLYPEKEKRIQKVKCTNPDFPLCPYEILDDNVGKLSSSFKPKLSSFGVEMESIEIRIHKYPHEEDEVFF